MSKKKQLGYRSPSSLPPDLAPCDLALFLQLKMKLKGRRFETVSGIQREPQAALNSIKENDFHSAPEAWRKQRVRCVRSQGDCSEGDGSQNLVG
jgi:hypothetical protein